MDLEAPETLGNTLLPSTHAENLFITVAPSNTIQPEAEAPPVLVTKSGRRLRVPKTLQDFIPTSTSGLLEHIPHPPKKSGRCAAKPTPSTPPPDPSISSDEDLEDQHDHIDYEMEPNQFGVFRVYSRLPQHDPEEDISLIQLADSPNFEPREIPQSSAAVALGGLALNSVSNDCSESDWDDEPECAIQTFAPFKNASTFGIMEWAYSGSEVKSAGEINRLVKEYIADPDFNPQDLQDFDFAREARRLDDLDSSDNPFLEKDGWRSSSVRIHVPHEGSIFPSQTDALVFEVQGIIYRSLIDLIKAANEDNVASSFHYVPHKLYCRHPTQQADYIHSSSSNTPN